MPKLSYLIRVAYDSAYDSEMAKKRYSGPYIYDGGGDLSKRWYVYFSFRNPATGKLERQPPLDTGVNRHKTIRERRRAAKVLAETIEIILKDGLYNPYDIDPSPLDAAPKYTVEQAVDFVLRIKKNEYTTGYADFKSRLMRFRKFLLSSGYRGRYINAVNKHVVVAYLNTVLENTSARNRNNTRTALSTFYTVLVDNAVVENNIVEKINVLKATPERNKSLTPSQEREIFALLDQSEQGKVLALYLKFVGWNILRPIEVNRLRIRDLDLSDKTLYVRAKNKPVKMKRIPDVLLDELPDFSAMDPDAYVFGRTGIGQQWEAKTVSRETYYSKLIRALVKKPLGLGKEYGAYSFRHTYIAKMFRSLLLKYSYFDAESRLMLITGHTSIRALRMYLRDIDAELPQDYSHLIDGRQETK